MPSWPFSTVLARLRRRRDSSHSNDAPPPPPQCEHTAPPFPIDRKIVEDPNALLDAETQDAFPFHLTPSTRLSSGDHYRHAGPSIISRTPKLATGGEWSTFGRKGGRRVPDTAEPALYTSPSTFTLSRLARPTSTPERHSNPSIYSPRQSPDMHFSSKPSSPTNTMSSKRDPRTPPRPSHDTALPTHVMCSATSISSSPANRDMMLDSPRTFGHPTPPNNPVDLYPSPPPALPPLDHPEFATRTMSSTPLRDRSNTLPARRSPRRDDLYPSLSLRLEHSLRHHISLPQTAQHETPLRPPSGRRRARTISAGMRQRRTSADWSSHQATVGVTSHANQAWPAQVSREILRLSFSPPRAAASEELPGSSGKPKSSRVRSADPVRRSDTSALSPSFLPFPHPSRPSSPPPSTASATLTSGREAIPQRFLSHQSLLENRTGSEQPSRFTMVKRRLSAIESRNGRPSDASGAAYASLGLSDPAASAPHAPPLLHPFSALAPSRSLPSGRISPVTMSSLQGEPSTPTPAPRQLSDKSRGKRKAEDNIDLTPPEQKKEGQRATFLLPSESRSQRISNASHAPSSYHRKRARLSSTSPFATPVQSRPASVQETPQSRGHYFASLSSSTGGRIAPPRTPSRAASTRSRQPPTPSTTRKHERHQSMSQVSIPISAIVSPHAPSISRSTKFHMRDPRRPPRKPNDTPWGLAFASEDEPGSPIHAWFFFFGFVLFPLWWMAGFLLRVPATRIAGDVDTEKGVPIDDPQIEHDAKIWRFRCRVLAVVSLFTYIPFIVLVAIFAPR